MPEILTPHQESLMPFEMGSPIRTPWYAHSSWGLISPDEKIVAEAYKAEWSQGTEAQLELVSQASIRAGLGNFPELLRRKTAEIAAGIFNSRPAEKPFNLLDIGAGPGLSALAVYEALPIKLRNQLFVNLIEPSSQALKTAESLMANYNIASIPFCGTDLEALEQMESASYDLLIAVASVHHHARIPFDEYARVLKRGAYAVFADWHQDIWEHPGRVLRFLERFDWPGKKEGLADWVRAYPQALDDPDKNLHLTPAELLAREQITKFWLAYKEIANGANLGTNAIWPLEGHRPVARYVEGLQETGFLVDSPRQLLSDSTLLMVTVAQKIK